MTALGYLWGPPGPPPTFPPALSLPRQPSFLESQALGCLTLHQEGPSCPCVDASRSVVESGPEHSGCFEAGQEYRFALEADTPGLRPSSPTRGRVTAPPPSSVSGESRVSSAGLLPESTSVP